MSVGIMVMSSMDAFFTLQLLELGAMEVNPIMDAAINKGTLFFAVSKMLLTAFGVLMLVFLAKARFLTYFRAGIALTVAFSMYACLVCYEFVFLLSHY